MWVQTFAFALVLGVATPALAAFPAKAPPGTSAMVIAAAAADPAGVRGAIAQAQERLAEIDASIAVLDEDVAHAGDAARQRARDAVAGLRSIRQHYREAMDDMVARGRQMTTEQLAAARSALAAPWTRFEQSLDEDVAAIGLDARRRKALVEARIRAEQSYWQGLIADLKAPGALLTAEERTALDARIARLKARADEAGARLGKLAQAGQSAWSALKDGFVNSRRIFEDATSDLP